MPRFGAHDNPHPTIKVLIQPNFLFGCLECGVGGEGNQLSKPNEPVLVMSKDVESLMLLAINRMGLPEHIYTLQAYTPQGTS